MFHKQIDRRSEPVRRIVALGESTTWGYSVSEKTKCWVNQTVSLLEAFQGSPIELINQGIGSNVLTPECPAYCHSARPSALERVDEELIALDPDMVLLSYGLNDSRGGTTVQTFRRAYQELIDRIRARIDPTIVILNMYYMHEVLYDHCENWEESDYGLTEVYNMVIQHIAEAKGCILADVYVAIGGVDWAIDQDHCHPNDLGHRIIAHRVFEAIVRNCSFVARRMPQETLITAFADRYGNGPERPSGVQSTEDVVRKQQN